MAYALGRAAQGRTIPEWLSETVKNSLCLRCAQQWTVAVCSHVRQQLHTLHWYICGVAPGNSSNKLQGSRISGGSKIPWRSWVSSLRGAPSPDEEALREAHAADTMLIGSAEGAKGKGTVPLGPMKLPLRFWIAPTEKSESCCEYCGALAATTEAYGTNLQRP